MTRARPFKLYFDLSETEAWHRRELESRLAASSSGEEGSLVSHADLADCVIKTETRFHFGPGGVILSRALERPEEHPTFVWSADDFPTGRTAGLYCSLPRALYDPRHHRTFSYPFQYNECVDAFDFDDADRLYGFVGGVTSGLRKRLLTTLRMRPADEAMLLVQGGPWHSMFDRSGVGAKRSYANALRRCRFFLCPRGNGVGSIRLFETMQAARVPVIISDAYVLPAGIDWSACAIVVPEHQLGDLPRVLRERADDWQTMAYRARRAWEDHFSDASLVQSVARQLAPLLDAYTRPTGVDWNYARRVVPYYARQRARVAVGRFVSRATKLVRRTRG